MTFAVARIGVKPRVDMRPPAPGHSCRDAQEAFAGRAYPTAVARMFLKPALRVRPPAPGLVADDAQNQDAGRPSITEPSQ